jgi:hypothetical protein
MTRSTLRILCCLLFVLLALPPAASADADGSSPTSAIPLNGTMTGTVNPTQTVWYQIGASGNPLGIVMDYTPSHDPLADQGIGFHVDWTQSSGQLNADYPGYYQVGQGSQGNLQNGARFWYTGGGQSAAYAIVVFNNSTQPIGYAIATTSSTNNIPWLNPPSPGAAVTVPTTGPAPAPSLPPPPGPQGPEPTATPGLPPPPGPQGPAPTAAPAGQPAPAPTASGPAPDGKTPQTAIPITAQNAAGVSGTIVGSTGGSVQFYTMNYQGGSAGVQIILNFQPNFTNSAVGFNLYGPNGFSINSAQTSAGTWTTASAMYGNAAASPVLIQVYNYTNGTPVNYVLTVQGLPGGSTATLTGGPGNSTPDKAIEITTVNATINGTLPGGTAQFFTIHYPGGGAPMTISMAGSPAYPGGTPAYGFNVYCPNNNTQPGQPPSAALTGNQTSSDVNSQTISGTLARVSSGTCTLVVGNNWPGQTVSYAMSIAGMGGPATVVSGNNDLQHAITLNSATAGATETLKTTGQAAFGFFNVQYPGNMSNFWLSITYSDIGTAPLNALGFNVYYTDNNGNQQQATINPVDDGTGIKSGGWYIQQANATRITIQAFDWQPGSTVTFTLYEVGAN